MNLFSFKDQLASSKSILNRLLLIASYSNSENVKILGSSNCDDVLKMRAGLLALNKGELIDCGAAGVVLRFLALKAARLPGKHELTGDRRLFERPQEPLLHNLRQLGVRAMIKTGNNPSLTIQSNGWNKPRGALVVDRTISSQFASAVILNAWELSFPLLVRFTSEAVSPSYMAMSLDLARQAGMQTKFVSDNELLIAQEQSVRPGNYQTEIDASSAFAIAALASVAGKAEIFDFPVNGLQPDCVFPKALIQLGVKVNLTNKSLSVSLAEKMKCINWNLKDCPDLFPILAVLCALAEGDSLLHGAPHLTYKESNRISKVAELLSLMDRDVDVRTDGLLIHGKNNCFPKTSVSFDPDQDHRLAMAAAIAQQAGFSIHLLNPECVNKSFPEFWEYVR